MAFPYSILLEECGKIVDKFSCGGTAILSMVSSSAASSEDSSKLTQEPGKRRKENGFTTTSRGTLTFFSLGNLACI